MLHQYMKRIYFFQYKKLNYQPNDGSIEYHISHSENRNLNDIKEEIKIIKNDYEKKINKLKNILDKNEYINLLLKKQIEYYKNGLDDKENCIKIIKRELYRLYIENSIFIILKNRKFKRIKRFS